MIRWPRSGRGVRDCGASWLHSRSYTAYASNAASRRRSLEPGGCANQQVRELRAVGAVPGGEHQRQRATALFASQVDLRGPATSGLAQAVVGGFFIGLAAVVRLLVGVVAGTGGVLVGAVDRGVHR